LQLIVGEQVDERVNVPDAGSKAPFAGALRKWGRGSSHGDARSLAVTAALGNPPSPRAENDLE
jgi:hypothetical protein